MPDNLLIYVADPYGVGAAHFATSIADVVTEISATETSSLEGEWITYDAPTLIDELRRSGVTPPAFLIDVGEALRLLSRTSRADGGERRWDFWKTIRPFFETETSWKLARDLHEGRGPLWHMINGSAHLHEFSLALANLWRDTKRKLEEQDECDRFTQIEIPVARTYHMRQSLGIGVAGDFVDEALRKAAQRKYLAYQQVADMIQVSPTGLNYWNVKPFIEQTDAKGKVDQVEGYHLRDQLKLARGTSAFARAFTDYMDASRDVEILDRLNDAGGRVFPTFHPFGTISSRTLVSDPFLQELRRDFRHVIAADEAMELLYFDYAQFEPGIMASLSGDEELQTLYNGGDVYKALSRAIYGAEDRRDLCKRIFLAFSYGMSLDAITRLLSDNDRDRTGIAESVSVFFGRFPRLRQFKADAERHLAQHGFVGTLQGNRRSRMSKGPLSAKERRWAVSQIVQGNASLIFKHATKAIAERFGSNSILLPMHDALLMQCTPGDRQVLIDEVPEIMRFSFEHWCPNVVVKISVGSFGHVIPADKPMVQHVAY
ncbi:DNA polymerase [Rhizobium leguminosarum]|uniref:DNA polymerase n=1 Tax=Rhizobium leguminosarum TaxID=384 RepID=UPI003F956ACD